MTKKRFSVVCCVTDWYIEDKLISPFAVLTPHQASDLLNELYNENEQLKSEIEKITKYKEHWAFISDCSIQVMNEEEKFKEDYLRIATNELKKLQEENEQLKSDVYDWKASAEDYLKLGKSLKKENEQLKERIKVLEDTIDGLTGTIAHFDLDEVM